MPLCYRFIFVKYLRRLFEVGQFWMVCVVNGQLSIVFEVLAIHTAILQYYLRTYNQSRQSSLRLGLKMFVSKTSSLGLRLGNTLCIRGYPIPLFSKSITGFCKCPILTLLTLMEDSQIPSPAKEQKDWVCSHWEDYKIYLILFPYPLAFQDLWEMASQF